MKPGKKFVGPDGVQLEATLFRIEERDALGRPTLGRICYDDETIGEVAPGETSVSFLLIFMAREDKKPTRGVLA